MRLLTHRPGYLSVFYAGLRSAGGLVDLTDHVLRVTGLRTEYAREPLGIDEPFPRFSWEIISGRRCTRQSAYQVLVADSAEDIASGIGGMWDSGKVDSMRSVHVVYGGSQLESATRYYWKVRVWDDRGRCSEYSEASSFEMGLLDESEFSASWIGIAADRESASSERSCTRPVPYFRKALTIQKPIRRARVYVTALGIYELYLNGQRVGEDVLAPGWTDYRRRVYYHTYDVTSQLVFGANAIGAVVADGWYCGHVAHVGQNLYGSSPALYLQLNVEYSDGSVEAVVSDGSWRWSFGPIVYADLLEGQRYDARLELPEWSKSSYGDSDWIPVEVLDRVFTGELRARIAPPIRHTESLKPRSIQRIGVSSYVVDFGQNMVGWVRVTARGSRGSEMTLDHAEMLDSDGDVYTKNLRSIRQVDKYVFGSSDEEIFEPRFTQHGFRYVRVSCTEPFALSDITGCVVHASMETTGEFRCSNPVFNRLFSNILWTQKGNSLSVPTDCPQRDERMGWLGDAQLFAPTACLNMDAALFYVKWMNDIVDAQSSDGAYHCVSPAVDEGVPKGVPAWSDAGVIVPWTLYQNYGDTRVIERSYLSMRRWIDHLVERYGGYLGSDYGFGDWLSLEEQDTPKDLISTAYFAYSTRLMSSMAQAIGRGDEAVRYRELHDRIKEAFVSTYVDDDGRIIGDTQTGYVLALYMELVPEQLRGRVLSQLLRRLEESNWHLLTGIIGTAYVGHVLSSMGYDHIFYRLLTEETYPSFGYMLKCGATTIWERWNGWTEHKGFENPSMNSFNHPALGSIGKWIYERVGGIALDPDWPGFGKVIIHPAPDPSVDWAVTKLRTIHGLIECSWRHDENGFEISVSIPANVAATVVLPCTDTDRVTESGISLREADGVAVMDCSDQQVVLSVGSGNYRYRVVV